EAGGGRVGGGVGFFGALGRKDRAVLRRARRGKGREMAFVRGRLPLHSPSKTGVNALMASEGSEKERAEREPTPLRASPQYRETRWSRSAHPYAARSPLRARPERPRPWPGSNPAPAPPPRHLLAPSLEPATRPPRRVRASSSPAPLRPRPGPRPWRGSIPPTG